MVESLPSVLNTTSSMKKIALIILQFLFTIPLAAGPFAPAANQEGTTAVPLDDPRITRWVSSLESYTAGEDVDEMFQDTSHAITPATTNALEVTSLGRGGEIVLEFDPPIVNGPGSDFAVFENAFAHTFLELAFVEVSVDGVSYERFVNSSETTSAVGPFGIVDATNIDGLAGKYIGGYGTPFDLSDLASAPAEIRFIRLLDITGGMSRDSDDRIIFDPFPTQGSAGFDLSGIAVLEAQPFEISTDIIEGEFVMTWPAVVGETYRIESSQNLRNPWQFSLERVAEGPELRVSFPTDLERQFYRVVLE